MWTVEGLYMSNKIVPIYTLIIISSIYAIDFSSEILEFDVSDKFVDTYGQFYFIDCDGKNDSISLYFPFLPNSGEPENIEIFSNDNKKLPWHWVKQDTLLRFKFAKRTCMVKIRYRTPIVKNRFVYILKSVKYWRQPLDSCRIIVKFPQYLGIDTNYPADTIFSTNSVITAVYFMKNFRPDKNFIIRVENKQ